MNHKWTAKDEKELVQYENQLRREEFTRKNAGFLVAGVGTVVAGGIVALLILMF